MSFAAGYGKTNVDMLFADMPRLPQEGEEIFTDKFSLCLGGGVPGSMVTLSRLGVEVKNVTELSDDMFSDFALKEFRKAGCEPINVYEGNKVAVNITAAAITKNDRTFWSYGNSENEVDENKVYEALKGAKAAAMHEGFPEVYRKLKAEGTVIILDTGFIEGMSLDGFKSHLEIADYYLPNRNEAVRLTGETDPKKAAAVLKNYLETAIVKLDADGCLIYDGKSYTYVRSIDEFIRVDSTGAGDAFFAGFMYGIMKDEPIEKCVLYGNITGGKCVTAVGCTTAYFTEKELLEMAEKYKDNIIYNY
ncbi:MAG: carbohydrate kinase family protein [Clostridia bacterium]|nr:carbohydrate kinase family protein [Clostridia bacterium]